MRPETYQLDKNLIIASTDKISLYGELVFGNTNSNDLIFISAGMIEMSSGSSLTYQADTLGFGSFDSRPLDWMLTCMRKVKFLFVPLTALL